MVMTSISAWNDFFYMVILFTLYLCIRIMFRWVTTISLLTIILLQIAGKWLILADYALNKEYIARTLCVNKAKPAMHCNGQCHLRKQLQKEENGGSQEQNRSSHQKFQEVFFDTHTTLTWQAAEPIAVTMPASNTALYSSMYTGAIFHPPAA
jgi:hypothetical protein